MVYDFKKVEEKTLEFWKKAKIYEKVRKKNTGKKKYYFLDGPPYTSGRVHLGTAWNKALKDMVLRYKRMRGFDVWDRAGYDMQGLPIEHKVQAKLKLSFKEDIEKFGVAKFVNECEKLSVGNLKLMNEDFKRLGVWMDFENAYQSITEEFIDGVWWLVKKAHKNGRLYEGFRSVPWDYFHQSALAKHELEYKSVVDKSIFWKFKVKNKENEYLILWSTTPWTLAYNLGVMANPELDYARAKVDGEVWILAAALANPVIQAVADKKYTILETFKGNKLEGLECEHPFYAELKQHYDRLKKESRKVHTIVLSSEYVSLDAGSGLVHMAPGCGPEDYEVGHRNGIPPWNNLTEDGHYPSDMGKFSGRHAREDNDSFITDLEEAGVLIKITEVEHEYPFGQRSQKPVIFRATKQWFFKVEDLKKEMIKENNKVKWVPMSAYNAFNAWLENLRDNSITKQRFWGTPVPIWRNVKDEKDYLVIGSIKELEKLSGKKVKNLHKPWIDEVEIKPGNRIYRRIPDILDVWVDAGTVSWNCLDFPRDKKKFEKLFPADFILEGKDQIRGWFNLLMVASMVSMKKPSFKAVYMHGFVQDASGRKFSKSLGNAVYPDEVIEKYGADTFRYYFIGGANPAMDLNYNENDVKVKFANLGVLWNLTNYLINYADGSLLKKRKRIDLEERYILSKLNTSIKEATEAFDEYRLNEIPLMAEKLFLSLSREYVQMTRQKMEDDRNTVLLIVFEVLNNVIKVLAPIAPFITEKIYQELKTKFKLKKLSVHLFEWPKYNNKLIDKKLEEKFEWMNKVVQEALAQREKAGFGVRWPLPKLEINVLDKKMLKEFEEIIKKQVNVKELKIARGDFLVKLDINITKELEKEGFLREVLRRIQALRKKQGLNVRDKITLNINSDFDL
ncbi:MAG: isoleucine--tRNA ligase, partial [Nanoarchaeota archaeon]